MTTVNQVKQTTDYSKFKTLKGNRNVNSLHVERIKRSIKEDYLMSPIIVNERFEIIDGQHRFSAIKAMNLPVNFIVVEGYGLREVQLLNTNMSNWKKIDYLNAFCDLGYPEYLKMRQFMKDFPEFGIQVSEYILVDNTMGANSKTDKVQGEESGRIRSFQQGDLKIKDLKLSYENAEKIMMLKPYYDGFNRATFVKAMIGLFKHPNYNHSQMLQKLKLQPLAIGHCANVSQYKILLENIYNYKSREKVSLQY